MKSTQKETFYERNFSHILVIGLAMSITLLVMVTYVMPQVNSVRGVNQIDTESVKAESPYEPMQARFEYNKYSDDR